MRGKFKKIKAIPMCDSILQNSNVSQCAPYMVKLTQCGRGTLKKIQSYPQCATLAKRNDSVAVGKKETAMTQRLSLSWKRIRYTSNSLTDPHPKRPPWCLLCFMSSESFRIPSAAPWCCLCCARADMIMQSFGVLSIKGTDKSGDFRPTAAWTPAPHPYLRSAWPTL